MVTFPMNIEISIENSLASETLRIVNNILLCYKEWKDKIVTARGKCSIKQRHLAKLQNY